MKDSLEKFISENRSQFDVHEPREGLWAGVEKELVHKKQNHQKRIWMVAASLIIIMVASVIVLRFTRNDSHSNVAIENNSAAISDPQIEEAQAYYASLIEVKRNEINQYRKTQPQLVKEFDTQLQELNLMYKELVPQVKDKNKKEIVLQALITNLQLQLQILNKQLEIVQQVNVRKNEKKKNITL